MLDRSPDWERLTERIALACESVPRMRERVVNPPLGLGTPHWQHDEFFDIGFHLRRVVAPAPGDRRALLDIAGPIAMGAFDKDRPLWEFTLVDGLAGGQAAFIQKVHHSFTDGVGAVELAKTMLDDRRNPPRPKPQVSTAPADAPASGVTGAVSELASEVRSILTSSANFATSLTGAAGRSVIDPAGAITSTVRQARSVGKLLAPVTAPLSPTITGRGMSRRLDTLDVPIDELLAAAHHAGCTLNDAFLAAIAGGMRRYHDRHDAPVDRLRVTMPINLRRDGDPKGGNRFAPARFALPIDEVDAAKRMRVLDELAGNWRREPALPLTNAIAGVLMRLPSPATASIFGALLKGIDLVATNIPGLDRPMFLAGAKVVREYGFAPTSGSAFSIALLSHLDQCCIGINADTAAIADPEVLTECLRQGFDEVLAVAAVR